MWTPRAAAGATATIALADRVVLIDDGRVVAEGTHDELLETSAKYRDVLAQAEPDAAGAGALPASVAPVGRGAGS